MHPVSRGHQVTPQEQIAAIAGMQVEIRHLITSIDSLADDVRELKTQLDRGRGVWATLVCVGAVSATLISAGAWAFEHFFKGVAR
jgi:prefoldin subunit 5